MKVGEHVIIKEKGKHYNMVALLVDIKGNFGVLKVRGETSTIIVGVDKLKELKDE